MTGRGCAVSSMRRWRACAAVALSGSMAACSAGPAPVSGTGPSGSTGVRALAAVPGQLQSALRYGDALLVLSSTPEHGTDLAVLSTIDLSSGAATEVMRWPGRRARGLAVHDEQALVATTEGAATAESVDAIDLATARRAQS